MLRALRRRALAQPLPVYLVGGPVRDVLLDFPVKDLDFVVEGDAPAVARQLAEELGGDTLVHSRFGTATVVVADARVDVVTARHEVYPRPAALPEVSPGTILDDLARRDFSINAMALPLAERYPGVLDPMGGLDDLAMGVIRILHQRSFVDDPTRVLRAIRYEQRLGFRIEDETLSRLRDSIAQGHLSAISGDRLRHELERILQEERPELALDRALGLGVLAAIHPALRHAGPLARLVDSTNADATGHRQVDPLSYLAALVYPLSPGEGEGVVHRLNLPNDWARVVRDTIILRKQEPALAAPSLSPSGLVRLVEGLSETATQVVSRVSDSSLVARRLAHYSKELRFVAPALNGRDLLAMGVPFGPRVGEILHELHQARLDGRVGTEAEERALVQELLIQRGGQSPDERGA